MNHTHEIRKYIVSNFLFGESGTLQDETSFLESGVIDSTGILELIMFIETTYNLKVTPEETLPENLDSINKVARFVARKQSAGQTPTAAGELPPFRTNPEPVGHP